MGSVGVASGRLGSVGVVLGRLMSIGNTFSLKWQSFHKYCNSVSTVWVNLGRLRNWIYCFGIFMVLDRLPGGLSGLWGNEGVSQAIFANNGKDCWDSRNAHQRDVKGLVGIFWSKSI